MQNLIFTLGCLCLVVAVGLAVYRRYCLNQMETGRMLAGLEAEGTDPDTVFLRAVAHLQAEERGRRRSPKRWMAVRYIRRTQRRFTSR
jgi:hypothetical protein